MIIIVWSQVIANTGTWMLYTVAKDGYIDDLVVIN